MSTRAVIYARISDARDGDTAGVDRQTKDCQALADERGWTVVGTYVDNDVSAYSGRRRPAYEDMLAAVGRGDVDCIVVWATDRLYRRLADLERLVDTLGDVPVEAVKSGEVNLSTADGRMTARILGSVSQHSSEKAGERISRQAQARAAAGGFGGGARRYGYTANGRELVPEEVEVLRRAYRHVADGGSLRGLAATLQAEGVVGAKGAPITAVVLRDYLLRPMNAGHGYYKGELLPNVSQLPRVVDPELWEQVRAILNDPARRAGRGRPARALLTGTAVCGKCDGPMQGSRKRSGAVGGPIRRVYQCRFRCQARNMAAVDGFIVEMMLRRLEDQHDVVAAAAARQQSHPPTEELAEAGRIRARLDALADLLNAGDLDPADYATATRRLRASLAAVEARIAASATSPAARVAVVDNIREWWDGAGIDDRRALVADLVERVVIEPAGHRSGPRARVDGIEVTWR